MFVRIFLNLTRLLPTQRQLAIVVCSVVLCGQIPYSYGQSSAALYDEHRKFDIAGGDAAQTLLLYAVQADVTFGLALSSVSGVKTNPVSGFYSPSKALELLLANTPLVAHINNKKQLILLNNAPGNEAEDMKESQFKKGLIATALSAISIGVTAQDVESADTQEQAATVVETIEVRGIRQSLAKSISIKKENTAMVDAVVAEDIGKFPDANIAESLQRIPGVYLERDGASNEGNRITIRGLDSSYAVTTINGAPVHTTSSMNVGTSTRDFNYDVFPSELFGQVNVYKSSMAELTEGGIGGTVDLQTPRPFDGKGEETGRYSVSAGYNDASESFNPKLSALYSNTWDNFGALFGIAYASSVNTRSGYETTGQYNTNALGKERKGTFRFNIDYDDPRVNLGDLTQEQVDNAFLPRFHRAYASENTRERLSSVISLQYMGDDFEVSLDTLLANLTDQRDEYTFGVAIRNSGQNGVPGIVPMDVFIDENNNLFGTFGNTTYFAESFPYDSQTDFYSVNLRGQYFLNEDITIKGQLTRSQSKAELYRNKVFNIADGVTSVIDSSQNTVYPVLTYDRDFTDPTAWNNMVDIGFLQNNEKDEDVLASLQVQWNFDAGDWYGNVKFGVSQATSTKTSTSKNGTSAAKSQILSNGKSFNDMSLSELVGLMDNSMPISPFAQKAGEGFPTTWSSYSRNTIESFFMPYQALSQTDIDFNSSFEAEEKVSSVFIQTDLRTDIFDRAFKANLGVRLSDTDVTANNYTLDGNTYIPNVTSGGYSTVLPSVNMAYDLTDELELRAAIGKTITRVGLNRIAANVLIADPFKAVATAGNPDLTPEESLSKDVSLSWYFSEGGLLSAGLFWKTIQDQPVESSTLVTFESLKLPETALGPIFIDPNTGKIPPNLDIVLNSYENGAEQKLSGFEIAYQQNFTFLPAPFNNLGTIASYTNVDTKSANWVANNGDVYNIPTVPKYGYTLATYYEDGPIALRVSYAFKSEKYVDPLNRGNDLNRVQASIGYLDASIGYKVSEDVELRFEATNLSDALEYQYYPNPAGLYGDGKSRKNAAYYSGRTFTLGLRGAF
ncbi:TonB-dependent receptor [Aestuariibacter sp. GS-14]|nr:TonB-dependent receptor [Aestuariibacter sp. GS-14]